MATITVTKSFLSESFHVKDIRACLRKLKANGVLQISPVELRQPKYVTIETWFNYLSTNVDLIVQCKERRLKVEAEQIEAKAEQNRKLNTSVAKPPVVVEEEVVFDDMKLSDSDAANPILNELQQQMAALEAEHMQRRNKRGLMFHEVNTLAKHIDILKEEYTKKCEELKKRMAEFNSEMELYDATSEEYARKKHKLEGEIIDIRYSKKPTPPNSDAVV